MQVYNDTLLVSYLAAMTKGTNAVNELIEKVFPLLSTSS